jgi:enoyl-CoA hydratase/carnithine racemase
VIRAIVQFESEPDPERYRKHLDEFTVPVECSAFRHGKVFGSPFGEPAYRYYAEFEWDDMDSFKAAVNSDAFVAAGDRVTEPSHPRPVDPSELGFETIVYEKAPPRATIRLNRPDVLNAFDFRMLREISRSCEDASWDDDVRAVVVTGTGRAFCVGADLRSWGEDLLGNSSEYWKWFGAFKDMHDRLREIGKPTIARVNGIAVGGGNELQMACDLAVMVDTAFIRHVGLQHGSVPAGGATQWLQLMVGDRRAREIVFLCDEIPAAQAEEWGLVNRAVPESELDAAVDEWVEKLAAKLPQTTRYAKQQLNVWRDLAWHQTIGHARDWLAMSMLGEEAQGAVRGFLDRSGNE